jgi:uncharacterized protein YjbI with pentapeptide repeats
MSDDLQKYYAKATAFLALALYLAIIPLTITHKDLLIGTAFTLPIVQLQIPIQAFVISSSILIWASQIGITLMYSAISSSISSTKEAEDSDAGVLIRTPFKSPTKGSNFSTAGIYYFHLSLRVLFPPLVLIITHATILPLKDLPLNLTLRLFLVLSIATSILSIPSNQRKPREGHSLRIGYVCIPPAMLCWSIAFLQFPGDGLGIANFRYSINEILRSVGLKRLPSVIVCTGEDFSEGTQANLRLQEFSQYQNIPNLLEMPYGLGIDLSHRDLRGCILDSSRLPGADLRGARLEGASLKGTDLRLSNLSKTRIRRANFHNARLSGAFIVAADIVDSSFDAADLSGSEFRDSNVKSTDFWQVNWQGANIFYSRFFECDFMLTRFDGTNCYDTVFTNNYLVSTSFLGARFKHTIFTNCALADSDFRHVDFTMGEFNKCNLSDSDFSYANFSSVDIDTSSISDAIFFRSTLSLNISPTSFVSSVHEDEKKFFISKLKFAEKVTSSGGLFVDGTIEPHKQPFRRLSPKEAVLWTHDVRYSFAKLATRNPWLIVNLFRVDRPMSIRDSFHFSLAIKSVAGEDYQRILSELPSECARELDYQVQSKPSRDYLYEFLTGKDGF